MKTLITQIDHPFSVNAEVFLTEQFLVLLIFGVVNSLGTGH